MAATGTFIFFLVKSAPKPTSRVLLIALPTSAPCFLCLEKIKMHLSFEQISLSLMLSGDVWSVKKLVCAII